MAFDLFADAGVDVAVVEVGLGGRLDSTNVLRPLVAGVVSVGIDHVEYLGDTREQIAHEKAGIFKPGVPAVVGETDPEIRGLLARLAVAAGARPVRVVAEECEVRDVAVGASGTAFTLVTAGGARTLRTPLAGHFQAANTATALVMLDAAGAPFRPTEEEVSAGLERVSLPGRFQRHGRFIFDVAHNRDGAAVLAETVTTVRPPAPVAVLLTVLADKDWRGIMTELARVADVFVVTTAPTAPASRAWRPEEAVEFAAAQGWRAELVSDFDAAMERALGIGETVLVTGSFHTVGDAMARLQVAPSSG
jgi:dihydrofolate synthase / folylpolyglutamate synthase